MRTIRTMVSPVMRLSASSGSMNSKEEPQRAQKSRTLPALKPSLFGPAAIDHPVRRAAFDRPGMRHRLFLDGQNRVVRVAEDKIRERSPEPVASMLCLTTRNVSAPAPGPHCEASAE